MLDGQILSDFKLFFVFVKYFLHRVPPNRKLLSFQEIS